MNTTCHAAPCPLHAPRRAAGRRPRPGGCAGTAGKPPAQQIHVMTSGGFTAAYNELTPQFERSTGMQVQTAYGASMGAASDSIPSRLARGEPADLVILARPALDALVAQGRVVAGSQVDLVRSSIGLAVRAGAPRPDISTVEALKRALIAAPSIAYSASASGVYYETELLRRSPSRRSRAEEQAHPERARRHRGGARRGCARAAAVSERCDEGTISSACCARSATVHRFLGRHFDDGARARGGQAADPALHVAGGGAVITKSGLEPPPPDAEARRLDASVDSDRPNHQESFHAQRPPRSATRRS